MSSTWASVVPAGRVDRAHIEHQGDDLQLAATGARRRAERSRSPDTSTCWHRGPRRATVPTSTALKPAPDFARRTAATGQVVGSDVQYLEYCGRFASAVAVSVCVAQGTGQRLTARIVV